MRQPVLLAKVDRPNIFWEYTRSICPECKRVIDAQIYLENDRVIMRKRCPEHGAFESLVFADATLYTEIARYNKPGTLPLEFATEIRDGCPHDCGLCPDHQQHTCLAIIEVNNGCNLDCPVCLADSGTNLAHGGYELTYEQVNFMLDKFVAAEGNPEVVQFSGGEPTLHPQILDFVALANTKGIRYVMLNTNGIRIARDDIFLARLAGLKPHIYLQFDGFDESTNVALRGKPNLLETKLKALDRLASVDVPVILVAAVEFGVNDHEVGSIVEFGLRHPAVYGVTFQSVFHTARHIPADPLSRMTIPDVLKGVQAQTNGLFQMSDFVPVPCCMPNCHFVTYALLDGDQVTPIPRMLDVDLYLDYIKNRTLPGLSDELLHTLEQLWSSSAQVGSERVATDIQQSLRGIKLDGNKHNRSEAKCRACHSHLPLSEHEPRDLARHIFMINARDFMDPYTFNLKNMMKCCVAFLVPDGRMIPFCAYNSVGYREQVTGTLMAAERTRHDASLE